MNLLARINSIFSPARAGDEPRIAVFGDSHTAALLRASEGQARRHHYDHIKIMRLRKEKHGKIVGDADLSRFCNEIRHYRSDDFVFSAVAGNQYAIISTVRAPIDYDFLTSETDDDVASDAAQMVPFRAIAGYIDTAVQANVGPMLRTIRDATRARVFHVAPPPPKEDNEFIAKHFESRFLQEGIEEFGPARPQLRLKCWKLQLESLRRLCDELDIELVLPPGKSVNEAGFLKPHCYANDVTHGNRRYGEMVLRQIVKISDTAHKAQARAA